MFKDKIKELRLSNHLTQEQFAQKLFVSRSAVAKWEQGRGIPKYDTVKDIATTFNVSVEELYKQDEVHEVINVIEKDNNTVLSTELVNSYYFASCLSKPSFTS